MIIVRPEKSSHWYYRNGKACYEVPNKSKPDQMRSTTIKDARKHGLLPSVTSILKMIHKPALEAWKIEQAITSTLTMPKHEGEPEPIYLQRIVEDYRSVAKDAAELGTAVHKSIELYQQSGIWAEVFGEKIDSKLGPIMKGYAPWAEENIREVLSSGLSFSTDSYGGKTDMMFSTRKVGRNVLADFKTRSTKPGVKITRYPEMGMQLAAYANGLGLLGKVKLWNVVISTTEPGRIEVLDWSETAEQEYEAFANLLKVWCHVKKFNITKEQEDEN